MKLSHFDESGASRIVDVSGKAITERSARSTGCVVMNPNTLTLIRDRRAAKGDVLEVARLAGIMAAKRTDQTIPLCHTVPLSSVEVAFAFVEPNTVTIEATAKTVAQTGVEMESLVAVSAAALTIYDMCKSVDREMTIERIRLEEKRGGRSGHFVRNVP